MRSEQRGASASNPSLNLPRLVTMFLILAWAVRAAVVWHRLPPVLADHFDIEGHPNGWSSKPAFFGFAFLIIVGLCALLWSMPYWLHRVSPSSINLPAVHYWLHPERARASMRKLGPWMAWLALLGCGLVIGVTEASLRANMPDGIWDSSQLATVITILFVVGLLVWVIAFTRAFAPPRK